MCVGDAIPACTAVTNIQHLGKVIQMNQLDATMIY